MAKRSRKTKRPRERLVFIVLGPPPSHLTPITIAQLQELVATRADVELKVGDSGSRAMKDMILVDTSGRRRKTLTLIDGRLQVNNPNDETIEWMLELAMALNGRVIDHALRTFRTVDETYIHPDDVPRREALARQRKLARNRFVPSVETVIKWAIVGFFIVVAAIGFVVFDR